MVRSIIKVKGLIKTEQRHLSRYIQQKVKQLNGTDSAIPADL